MFEHLPGDPSQAAPRVPSVCLVTPELLGWPASGGIGTAYGSLAEALAAEGLPVTVLCAFPPGAPSPSPSEERSFREVWKAKGVEVVFLEEQQPPSWEGDFWTLRSYRIFCWLRQQADRFSTIHVPERLGLGYVSLLAKRQGTAFPTQRFVVGSHGGESFGLRGHREFPTSYGQMEIAFLERESVRLADVLVSPSRFHLEWMREERWEIPKRAYVEQNLLPETLFRWKRESRRSEPVRELVFFGRLESRKGVPLFCDALDRIVRQGAQTPERVVFLGSVGGIEGRSAAEYVQARAASWPWPWEIVSGYDRDRALGYLREGRGRLAVMPSRRDNLPYSVLECAVLGIPFLASHEGGIPEIIAPPDRQRVLFAPDPRALAERLIEAFREGVAPASPDQDPKEVKARWIGFHMQLAGEVAPHVQEVRERPLISVCLVPADNPSSLEEQVASLRRQTYPQDRFEVILVDRAGALPEARKLLRSVESEFSERGWKIVRHDTGTSGAARNHAARLSTGNLLFFLDPEVVPRPDALSVFAQAAVRSDADLWTSIARFLDDRGQPTEGGESGYLPGASPALLGLFRRRFLPSHFLLTRAVFEALGGFSEEEEIDEAYHFCVRSALAGRRRELVPFPLCGIRTTGPIPSGKQGGETAGNISFLDGREYDALLPYRIAQPRGWEELPFFTRGLWSRAERLQSEVDRLREEEGRLHENLRNLNETVGRLTEEGQILQGELALYRDRPLRALERHVRLSIKSFLGLRPKKPEPPSGNDS